MEEKQSHSRSLGARPERPTLLRRRRRGMRRGSLKASEEIRVSHCGRYIALTTYYGEEHGPEQITESQLFYGDALVNLQKHTPSDSVYLRSRIGHRLERRDDPLRPFSLSLRHLWLAFLGLRSLTLRS